MVVVPGATGATARPGLVAAAAVAVVVEGSDPPRSSDLILAKGRRSAGSGSAISESAISGATHVLSLLMLLIESKDKLQSSASCRLLRLCEHVSHTHACNCWGVCALATPPDLCDYQLPVNHV